MGYLRTDVPLGHPDFGKLQICVCRRAKVTDLVRERLFELSHLDELKDLTFESFEPRGRKGLGELQANSLEMAFNQAQHYAQSLNGWLLLQGGYGCGKTHLAAAVANFAVGMGVPTFFLTVPDLLDTLRFAYNNEDTTFENRFDEIRNAKLLVLDDFGTQNATGWAQEKLFQIVNYRYINKLSTVVTTNLALDEIEARIRSRLADPDLVTQTRINTTDYRRPMGNASYAGSSLLQLLGNRTFQNFYLREHEGLEKEQIQSLKDAYNISMGFADKPKGWLIITGDYGCGKTHLAAAIANYREALGEPTKFFTAQDLLDELRKTFDENSLISYSHRFEEIKSASFLVLDDLETHSLTPWGLEKLSQIINHRLLAEFATVVTISTDATAKLDTRIGSRLEDERLCKKIGISAPSYHGKSGGRKTKSR